MISLFGGIVLTAIVSVVLIQFGISINVVLPVAAPVWAGSTTLIYNYLGDKFE